MSVIPEILGDGYDFTFNGASYHLGLVTQEVKSRYEKACYNKECQKLRDVKEFMSSERWREKADSLSDKYLAGGFSIAQADEVCNPLMNPEYQLLMIASMIGCSEIEVIKFMSNSWTRDLLVSLFKLALRDSFPGVSFDVDGDQKKTAD